MRAIPQLVLAHIHIKIQQKSKQFGFTSKKSLCSLNCFDKLCSHVMTPHGRLIIIHPGLTVFQSTIHPAGGRSQPLTLFDFGSIGSSMKISVYFILFILLFFFF